jgi:hypothetical protein
VAPGLVCLGIVSGNSDLCAVAAKLRNMVVGHRLWIFINCQSKVAESFGSKNMRILLTNESPENSVRPRFLISTTEGKWDHRKSSPACFS